MAQTIFRYIVIAALAMPINAVAQPTALVPSGPDLAVPITFGGKRVPVWGGNGLLVADGPLASPNIFMAFDREGRQVFGAGFSIAGAYDTRIRGFARGADGTVAACGISYAGDGRNAPFISWISADGNSQQVIRTEPYTANLITVAPDGTLWTVGMELNPHGSEDSDVNLDAGVLRHFDRSGKTLGAFMPRSSMQDFTDVAATNGRLVAAADRIGWLHRDYKGQGAYVELSSDGNLASYPLPQLPNLKAARVGGLAITDSGDVFAELDNLDVHSFSLYALHRSDRQWLRLKIPASGRWAQLLGSIGNELALSYGPGGGLSTVHFFAAAKQ